MHYLVRDPHTRKYGPARIVYIYTCTYMRIERKFNKILHKTAVCRRLSGFRTNVEWLYVVEVEVWVYFNVNFRRHSQISSQTTAITSFPFCFTFGMSIMCCFKPSYTGTKESVLPLRDGCPCRYLKWAWRPIDFISRECPLIPPDYISLQCY